MNLFHPPLGAFLRRLRDKYSKEPGDQAETSQLTARERGVLAASSKPSVVQSIVLAAAIALVMPILPARVAAQAIQYSILHSFVAGEGTSPYASLIQGSDGNFYGTTAGGGLGYGSVFKMTPAGVVTTLHLFGSDANDGRSPYASLIQGSDGNFYGTTQYGGSTFVSEDTDIGNGTIFQMTPAGAVTILHSFGDGSVADDGVDPQASLIQTSDGNFYGTTVEGGSVGAGTVFKMTPAGVVTTLHSFASDANDGYVSYGSLILGSDGYFYGTTVYTLGNDRGTAFRMDRSGIITFLHRFGDGSVTNDGRNPYDSLIQDSDGNFYGTTNQGGSVGAGTVFKMTPAGAVTILHSFGDGSTFSDGGVPYASLIQGSDGNFYGTTILNGGTVFEMSPAGVVTILHRFGDGSTANDGTFPYASLIQGSDGNFYGTTLQGGSANRGTAFKLSVPTTHFSVSAASTATAGSAFNVTVTALNAFNGKVTNYTGTVHFGSSDGNATLPADATLKNGVGTFPATLVHAGVQTIIASDDRLAGTSGGITVGAASPTHFVTSAPSSATAGVKFPVTIVARDAYDNTAVGYTAAINVTSTDPGVVLPTSAVIANGSTTIDATLTHAGSQTITATDQVSSSITGTSGSIAVGAGAASRFVVSAPATATAGASFNVTVAAVDAYNNAATGYNGMVLPVTSSLNSSLPPMAVIANGTGTFSVTLNTSGSQIVGAFDLATFTITGSSGSIQVTPAPTTHFALTTPFTATAGSAFTVTVTALNAFNGTDTGYTGTVHFTSTDGSATLPSDATLTSGTGTFSVTLRTAGSQTVTATDTTSGTVTGTGNVTVSAVAGGHLALALPTNTIAGTPFAVNVTAQDSLGNTNTGYTGTLHFTSNDPTATLPGDTKLTNGSGSFQATLTHAALMTIRATDTGNSSLTATASTTVSPAAATHLTVAASATTNTGGAVAVTVTARDPYENVAKSFADTIHFTSTDPAALLPADAVLTNGTKSFIVKYYTPGSQSVTATDTANASLTATATSTVNVVASKLVVTVPANAAAGVPFNATVTATDAYGNVATGYTGTVHFTTTDALAVLPSDMTLTNGTGTFSATLKTAGTRTITATDMVTSTIKGVSGSITLFAAAAASFTVTTPASATAGSAFYVTVTAKDAYGNVATGYTGTVHLSSTDPLAVLYSDATLTKGVKQFTVKLKTIGSQTVTVTDTSSPVTGTSGSITVH